MVLLTFEPTMNAIAKVTKRRTKGCMMATVKFVTRVETKIGDQSQENIDQVQRQVIQQYFNKDVIGTIFQTARRIEGRGTRRFGKEEEGRIHKEMETNVRYYRLREVRMNESNWKVESGCPPQSIERSKIPAKRMNIEPTGSLCNMVHHECDDTAVQPTLISAQVFDCNTMFCIARLEPILSPRRQRSTLSYRRPCCEMSCLGFRPTFIRSIVHDAHNISHDWPKSSLAVPFLTLSTFGVNLPRSYIVQAVQSCVGIQAFRFLATDAETLDT